ncbi:MAG: hypothetical protein GF364_10120 [Candidatus Lokiarchaeota archaeon]|nr:hypothetical protein [Candidatus Lokiarchaeota archaeon]
MQFATQNDTAFEDYTGRLTMATMNYPTWSGEKLVHDPTFIVFHGNPPQENSFPWFLFGGGAEESINSYLYVPLFATLVITVAIIAKKSRRKSLG